MLFTAPSSACARRGLPAYLLREGEFVQVTKDDTYVQMLVDEGRISAEEASSHPQRSLLHPGTGRRTSTRSIRSGRRCGRPVLLCSDGLTAVVHAETIAQTMREYVDPAQCASGWSSSRCAGGGPDNITVVIGGT